MKYKDVSEYISLVKNIYQKLQDEESKIIFKNRLLYSITNEKQYIENIVGMNEYGKKFLKRIHANDIYIFGGGIWGNEITKIYGSYIKGVFDNDVTKSGKMLNGILIQKPDDIIDEKFEGIVIITTKKFCQEISEQLLKLGMPKRNIYDIEGVIKEAEREIYFELDMLSHCEEEVFVDVGCLDATTSLNFAKWSNKFKKIYCLEPDSKNIEVCINNINNSGLKDKVELCECGAWSYNGMLYINSQGSAMSCISENEEGDSVCVRKLDTLLKDEKPTFIKMDIEGAEMEALKGAENIIKNCKPKLAISIYHKPEDIISLISLIMFYNSDYKLYLRHHSIASFDTVLYAIPIHN